MAIKNFKLNIDYLFVVWLKTFYDTRNAKVIVSFSTVQSPVRNDALQALQVFLDNRYL